MLKYVIVIDKNLSKGNSMEKIIFSDKYLALAGDKKDFLARVTSHHGEIYKIRTNENEMLASVSGKFAHNAASNISFPVVGDYIIISNKESDKAVIHEILKRSSIFLRKAAGTSNTEQAIAANIDYVFICMSLNNDFNLRRLERYLSISWDSGAVPVIVLTKSDLCDDVEAKISDIESIAYGTDIVTTSSLEDVGYDKLMGYIKIDKTVAFLGSSGVGKSTLINRLVGEDILETKEIREDDQKGRHTTTTRNLIYLESGGAVIDTPGMREIGVESGEVSHTFADIEDMALNCKFSDCKHLSEPGCAVKNAIEDGVLSEKRLESYRKLKIEMGYDGLNSKQLERQKLDRMFAKMGGLKSVKRILKEKKKNK